MEHSVWIENTATIKLKLCGEDVELIFTEGHIVDLQEILNLAKRYKVAIKSVVVSILCIIIAGCASLPPVEDNQTERQVIDIYDSHGNVKERMIIKDDYITIYDKDWKTKGYGKTQK